MPEGVLGRIQTVADWSRVFRDLEVWRPLVLAVLRRHGLADCYACVRIEPGQIAGTHAVFTVNRQLVVKIYGPFWSGDREREIAVLKRFASQRTLCQGGIALPHLLAAGVLDQRAPGTAGKEWPYVVSTYLDGVPVGELWPKLNGGTRQRLAASLGRALAELHAMDLDGLEGLVSGGETQGWRQAATTGPGGARDGGESGESGGNHWRARWLDFVAAQKASCQARHREWRSLPEHLIADLPGFLDAVGQLPGPGWQPSLLSCDITADHVLLAQDGDDWRITGLIDFGDAMVGDPEYEFVAAYISALDVDRSALDACLRAYGYQDQDAWVGDFERRMMAYTLLHVFPIPKGLPPAVRDTVLAARDLDEAAQLLWGRPRQL